MINKLDINNSFSSVFILILIIFTQSSVAETQNKNKCEKFKHETSDNNSSLPESKPSVDRNKRLVIDEEKSFEVFASRTMNYSGIYLEAGRYTFKFSKLEDWCDATVEAKQSGWSEQNSFFLTLLSWTHWISRFPTGHLYTVIGGIHNQWWTEFNMGVMQKNEILTVTQDKEGELYAYANDIHFMYFNNHGRVIITVKRVKREN